MRTESPPVCILAHRTDTQQLRLLLAARQAGMTVDEILAATRALRTRDTIYRRLRKIEGIKRERRQP